MDSVEADIFLVEGELRVGHRASELRPGRTLRNLYLEPLAKRIAENRGAVYGDGRELWLLIDVKSEPRETYRTLRGELARCRELFTTFRANGVERRAVTVIVSGERAPELLREEAERFATLDARFAELGSSALAGLTLLVSEDWAKHFAWRGVGEFSSNEPAKLGEMVARAHASGCVFGIPWTAPNCGVSCGPPASM